MSKVPGVINALAAVNVALSAGNGKGSPWGHDAGLLLKPGSTVVVSSPNTHEARSFTITNTGSAERHLTPSLQTLGEPIPAGATLNVTLDPSADPTFINPNGAPRAYGEAQIYGSCRCGASGCGHRMASVAYQLSDAHCVPGAAGSFWASGGLLDPAGLGQRLRSRRCRQASRRHLDGHHLDPSVGYRQLLRHRTILLGR